MARGRPARALGTSTRDPAVVEMFDDLSEGYDVFNRLVTGNLDLLWRKRLVDLCPAVGRALDFGCGTGDLTERLLERGKANRVAAIDITPGMLARARRRARSGGYAGRVSHARADGERLPFPDAAFDLAVSAFVMRNVGDRQAAYREIARVLKPGGSLVQLELGFPAPGVFRDLYYGYYFRAMPVVAGALYRDRAPYQYLADSLKRWPDAEGTARKLKDAGFGPVDIHELTRGVVAIHMARKASHGPW
ncbi:MAG TPA: ubiquinone/menaquinone biosynthesis methyltransferase [Candidatus Thermoplasmatota archaeon]